MQQAASERFAGQGGDRGKTQCGLYSQFDQPDSGLHDSGEVPSKALAPVGESTWLNVRATWLRKSGVLFIYIYIYIHIQLIYISTHSHTNLSARPQLLYTKNVNFPSNFHPRSLSLSRYLALPLAFSLSPSRLPSIRTSIHDFLPNSPSLILTLLHPFYPISLCKSVSVSELVCVCLIFQPNLTKTWSPS